MCMLKLVLYKKPGKWHNIRTKINLMYICREIYAQMYVYIYTLSNLVVYIYIYILFNFLNTHTCMYMYVYIHIYIYMSSWDGFCIATW